MTRRRLWYFAFAAGIVLIGALALWATLIARPPSTADGPTTAQELLSGVSVTVTVADVALAAAGATADFGVEEGLRRVNIRVVDEFHIEVRFESAYELVLDDPPYVCLVGPFWNPLDAGLSDRCWGDPDLQAAVAAQLPTDEAGHLVLTAGSSTVVSATIRRGDARCDYAPGEWHVDIGLSPIVDGSAVGRVDLPEVILDVPYQNPVNAGPAGTLELLPPGQTRVCSYPAAVYLRQGDPPVTQANP